MSCLTLALMMCGAVETLAKVPLPSDSRIKTGKLENGVTWMYRQHDNPPGKLALMMHVRTGSLNETDAQQGLAHFLEHMCFNGTENFPPGTLIPYFESIGMEFGADLNAFTSFDQTAYMLFTPDTQKSQIDKALMVLSDYAFRVTMPAEEIEKERGIVLEELRSRRSAQERIREKLWPELFAGARFAQRLPIGTEEVIKNAPRSEFMDYYQTWYRPENITVVVVGDTPAERVTPLIEKWFGKEKAAKKAREPKGPEFKPFTKQRAMVITDPEMEICNVQIMNIRPGRPPTVAVEDARQEMVEFVGTWIAGRRYDDMVKKGEASFRGAGVSVGNFFNDAMLTSGSATGETEDWMSMLEELILEVSRAREHGFTQREFDLAKKEIIASAERGVKTEPTRNARGIIREIVSSVNDREPVLSAQQELDLYRGLLDSITVAEVNAAFKKHFEPGTFAYILTMPDKPDVDVPDRKDVLAAARSAWARKVKPIEEADAPTSLLAKMPESGKVVEKSMDEDLKITSAWLSNGVRVHHRYMDYKKDSVFVSVAMAGGRIEETSETQGVTEVASLAVNVPATSRLSSTNIRDLMTGKNINVGSGRGGSGDAFTLSLSGSPADLETGLQLVHALVTDGKIEQSAFDNWKLQQMQGIEMREHMPRFKAVEQLLDVVSGGDPRLAFQTKDQVNGQNVETAQAWFRKICSAPIEVAVVGDMEYDAVMPLITKYIGSLPDRPRRAENIDSLRRFSRETGPLVRKVDVDTMTPQAMSMAGFIICDSKHTNDRRALQLASNILSSKLVKRIREELSIVYSIRAGSQPSSIYRDSGQFMAQSTCDPENADRVAEEVHAAFAAFAKSGPTAEELENAKKQVKENLSTAMLEPSYWWSVLRHMDHRGESLDVEKTELDSFDAFTAEQVRDAFRKYYVPTRQFSIMAMPVKKEAAVEKS